MPLCLAAHVHLSCKTNDFKVWPPIRITVKGGAPKGAVTSGMAKETKIAFDSPSKAGALPENLIFGNAPSMQLVRRIVERAASSFLPVLLCGESGVGKEIMAREIHRRSPWSKGPFVKVSCPAIPGTLIESELFGYEKGSFTGAWNTKPGRVEQAARGTLFMDEIGEIDPSLQAKLLQVLQDGQFTRIGAQQDTQADARIICATNRSLEIEIQAGRFRQDLYYRINVIQIQLPPLRERTEDIPAFIDYYIQEFSRRYNVPPRPISRELLQMLSKHEWPGNIRQLENCISRFIILGSEESLFNEMAARKTRIPLNGKVSEDGSIPLKRIAKQAVREMERNVIFQALQANHWNRKKTAQALKISYRSLLSKIQGAGGAA